MTVVATYFTAPGFADPPFDSAGYAAAYRELGERVRERGAEFVIVRGRDSQVAEEFSRAGGGSWPTATRR